jgi:hypothetical protein
MAVYRKAGGRMPFEGVLLNAWHRAMVEDAPAVEFQG